MARRRALVVGSRCHALNELDFVSGLATRLADALHDRGGWEPVTGGPAALIDPDIAALKEAVRGAFEEADREAAQLLIAFIGHGLAAEDDFYLMVTDSPATPDSDTALHLGQALRERLKAARSLDGLVVLVDACDAGEGAQAAGTRWPAVLAGMEGRAEVLAASGSAAYDGCFSRSLLDVFEGGITSSGDYLLPTDLVAPLGDSCPQQRPQHLAYNGGALSVGDGQEDVALWLAPNVARPRHALTGRPAAGLLDQVTRRVTLSPGQQAAVAQLVEDGTRRLRGFVGPAGSGKTTLMAFLIRPTLADTPDVPGALVKAAAFLEATSTPESIAVELGEQLEASLDGFPAARQRVVAEFGADLDKEDAFDRELLRPLEHCDPRRRVHLVLDGLDQVPAGPAAEAVHRAIGRLSAPETTTLGHVRVILGARSDLDPRSLPGLEHLVAVEVPAPTWADAHDSVQVRNPELAAALPATDAAVPGGWLTVKLAAALNATPTDLDIEALARAYFDQSIEGRPDAGAHRAVLALLVAAGTGPILPFVVLERALANLGHARHPNRIRDILVSLGPLIQRGDAGQPTEQVGMAHHQLLEAGLVP